MKYKINNIMKTGSFEGQYGKLDKYQMELEGVEGTVQLSQKEGGTAPSGEIEGEITEDPRYGKKFKRDRAGFGGGSRNDPVIQKAIIRQSSAKMAIERQVAIVQALSTKAKTMKEVEEIIKDKLACKHIIQIATYLAKYSEGLVTVVSESPKKEEEEKKEDDKSTDFNGNEDIDESGLDVDKLDKEIPDPQSMDTDD